MTPTFDLYRFCHYFDVFTMFWLYFILFSWGQYRGYLGVSWGQLGIGVREILIGRRDCPAQRSGRCLVLTSLRRGDRPATTKLFFFFFFFFFKIIKCLFVLEFGNFQNIFMTLFSFFCCGVSNVFFFF